jgi:putative membrane protein
METALGAAANSRHRRLVLGCLGVFSSVFVWSAIRPWHPADWMLENLMTLLGLWILLSIYRKLPFSPLAWVLSFSFLCLHEVGAHYTYAEVPWREWWAGLTGQAVPEVVAGQRNHFDRWVHFLYGLMLFLPWREVFQRLGGVRGFWSFAWPMLFIVASSTLYELLEWAAAGVFGGELGMAYLGTQGDIWDAHKDMALAGLGGMLAMFAVMIAEWRRDRGRFSRDWRESLTVRW